MIHLHLGMDWYGAVKYVGAFRVVTAFFHVNGLPTFPRYSAVIGQSAALGREWQIVRLARIDWQSVTIAYVRGVAGGLVVFGSIPLIFGFMFWLLDDGQADIPPKVIMSTGAIAIAVGAVLGAASYVLWREPKSRERVIRQIANSQLFAAADPALIDLSLVIDWAANIDRTLLENGISDYTSVLQRAHEFPKNARELLLLRVRCELALQEHDSLHECRTDVLLRDLAISF
jgi:hypothetical protein